MTTAGSIFATDLGTNTQFQSVGWAPAWAGSCSLWRLNYTS